MQCLRIVSTNVDTGEQVRSVRVPMLAVKTASRFMPASLFAMLDERLTKDIARDILDAAPKAADEVAKQRTDEESGVAGLIAHVEERRGGRYGQPGLPGSTIAEEWTERTLVYIE